MKFVEILSGICKVGFARCGAEVQTLGVGQKFRPLDKRDNWASAR
jgi:hypothetical protein